MNLDKTAYILIPPCHNNIECNFNPTFNGSLMKIVNSYNYLGITVDNQMKFKFHIQLLEKKFFLWSWYSMENKTVITQANFINILLRVMLLTCSMSLLFGAQPFLIIKIG